MGDWCSYSFSAADRQDASTRGNAEGGLPNMCRYTGWGSMHGISWLLEGEQSTDLVV